MVKLRVTEEELADYKSRAGELGLSLSDWIRSRLEFVSEGAPPVEYITTNVSPEMSVPPAKAKGTGLSVPAPTKVYDSEKPRAGRRTMICAHRRRPDEFCPRCD